MIKRVLSIAALVFSCFLLQMPVYASDSDGEEYITISVDAVDDSGDLKYALDTDDPSAFTDSNEFVVPAGTSHTIYVKDAAGNISSQEYGGSMQSRNDVPYRMADTEDEQKINIDLELGGSASKTSDRDEYVISGMPVESGSATVSSRIKTDGSDSSEKIFYTFTTKEGEVLYLIVDQSQSTDNVYLLDTVSIGDLKVLADGQTSAYGSDTEKKEDNLLSALTAPSEQDNGALSEQTGKKQGSASMNNAFIILIFAAIGGGAYYYLKIYRNKKDEAMDAMDAMDMDEFEPEEEEDEIAFDYDDAEKEKYLEQLISEDEDFYDTDPEEYAMSHMDAEDYDSGIEQEIFSEEDEDTDNDDGYDEEMEES